MSLDFSQLRLAFPFKLVSTPLAQWQGDYSSGICRVVLKSF